MTASLADPELLLGRWRMSRVVEDRRQATRSTVSGWLDLTRTADDRIHWAESGRWHRPDADVEVRRALWLVHQERGWWVLFEDGRDFHPWVPGDPVVHDCRPDTYGGLVTGTPERWTIRWDVSGPEKDYTMTTVLTPEG